MDHVKSLRYLVRSRGRYWKEVHVVSQAAFRYQCGPKIRASSYWMTFDGGRAVYSRVQESRV